MHKNNRQSLNNKNVKNENIKEILETKTKVSVLERISIALITISMFILVVSTFALLYLQNKPVIPTKQPEISSFTVILTSNDYQISKPDKDGYQRIEMTDFENNIGKPGEPDLPRKTFNILMPAGAKFKSLEVVSKESEVIEGKILVTATKTPQPIASLEENNNSDLLYKSVPEVPPKKEIYQSDSPYPQNIIEQGNSGKMRKFDILPLNFSPIQYKSLSKELTLFKSVTVKITYEQGAKLDEKQLADTAMDQDVKNLVLNYDQFANDYKPISTPKSATYHYIIIAPQTLATSQGMTNLVNYRESQGYLVHLETTEYINTNYTGTDLPEKIRNYLIANYLTWGFKYVALVSTGGTTSVIPMRYCYNLPTDYYYQDLTGIWNSSQEYCGSGVDWYPEVYVGRIPLDEATQLESYVDRLINYEGSSDPYKQKVLLAAGIWYVPCDAADTAEYLRNNVFLPNDYQTVRMYEETGTCPCTLPHDYDVSEENVVNHWKNDHYGIVYLAAHGNPYRICSKPCPQPEQGCQTILHRDDISQLSNSYPSLIVGQACSTASPDDPDNLGYKFIRQGGVSYVGNTRDNYDSDRIVSQYYFENLINKKQTNGKALAQARLRHTTEYYPGSLISNLYSEPLLNLTPYNLEITNPQANQIIMSVSVASVAIEGTVIGPNFDHYVLEWGQGTNPVSWSTQGIVLEDGGNQPKIEELLGTWDVSSITRPDYYTLKLIGYFGNDVYDYNVTFYLENFKNYIKWGSYGSGDGQFSAPVGLSIQSDLVYVVDMNNNRIQVFDNAGNYIRKWGSSGSSDGQFNLPSGLVINSNLVYVTDRGNDRVQVFNTSGTFIRKWGTHGSGNGQFIEPYGIAVNNNLLYVTDKVNNRIQVFDTSGTFVRKWGSSGSENGQFSSPHGLDIENNLVYVTDKDNHRIQVFDTNGIFITKWGSYGSGDGQFKSPRGLSIQSDLVYVADTDNHRIQVFDTNGIFITKWGSYGSGDGQFKFPYGITVKNNMVYVADSSNHRIQVFTLFFVCDDGTLYGKCNANRQYCNNGNLVNDCYYCGCASGCCEPTTNQCSSTCIDGTPLNQCSANKPKYCGMNNQYGENGCYLFDACPHCPCPDVKDANGTPKYYCKTNKGSMAGECAINPAYCDSKPVMYLPFNENSGTTTYDSTCYHNNGTITGASWVTGNGGSGYALSFDGSDDRVVVPYKNSLSVSKEIIISAKVKFNNLPNRDYSTIVKGPAYILRFLRNPNRLQGIVIEKDTADPYIIISNKTDWMTNTWYDIAFVYDRNYLRLYINGTQDNYQQLNIELAKGSSNLSIGNGYSIQFGWVEGISGVIDDVKIYSTTAGMAFPEEAVL